MSCFLHPYGRNILAGDLLSYKGAIFENLVADIFGKMERKLYYYHKDGGAELDFLMRYKANVTQWNVRRLQEMQSQFAQY
ncbi:MAG: DUF4143 domain-containing protein [Muribaculaceae bacterium]|nr:DUF4143 domain-containing protein [Muribaculaceae bacterium]